MRTKINITQAKPWKLLACASVAAVLTAALAPAMAADPPSAGDKTERVASDSWITTKVKSEILSSNLAQGMEVSVKTMNGVVTLTGKLPNQDAVEKVGLLAEKVKGVKKVDKSGLSVAPK